MTKNSRLRVAFGVAMVALAACSRMPPEPTWEQANEDQTIATNYRAADALLAQVSPVLSKAHPIIMATVVNIDDLDQSSTLGRLISEHISARFTQSGYRMIELKYRNKIYIKRSEGELVLTREIKELAQNYAAQAVIAGTYGQSKEFVFVNLKVIQPEKNIVLAAYDYVMPLNNLIKPMMRTNKW